MWPFKKCVLLASSVLDRLKYINTMQRAEHCAYVCVMKHTSLIKQRLSLNLTRVALVSCSLWQSGEKMATRNHTNTSINDSLLDQFTTCMVLSGCNTVLTPLWDLQASYSPLLWTQVLRRRHIVSYLTERLNSNKASKGPAWNQISVSTTMLFWICVSRIILLPSHTHFFFFFSFLQ